MQCTFYLCRHFINLIAALFRIAQGPTMQDKHYQRPSPSPSSWWMTKLHYKALKVLLPGLSYVMLMTSDMDLNHVKKSLSSQDNKRSSDLKIQRWPSMKQLWSNRLALSRRQRLGTVWVGKWWETILHCLHRDETF